MVDGDICNMWKEFSGPCAIAVVERWRNAHGGTLKGVLSQLTHLCHN